MRVISQGTIADEISFSGVGLHSGKMASVQLRPAPVNAGIVFKRTDISQLNGTDTQIRASATAVFDSKLGTSLRNSNGVTVATVEHLMAALAICGVDNVMVDVDAGELPILDGSAGPFVDAIITVGLEKQSADRRYISPQEIVRVDDGDRFIEYVPGEGRVIEVSIDFEDACIGRQSLTIDLENFESLQTRVAPARTFCRLRDVESMRSAGFSLGGSLDNAVIVDGDKLLNENGLRDPSEFALHKTLDLIGDLYLIGAPFAGRIRANKPGHELNAAFALKMMSKIGKSAGRRALPIGDDRMPISA